MMKKTLSMVLALVMLMSTISCLGITASAAAEGIKYFTMEFLINDQLVANEKLTIDFAAEKSYREQCEDYLYAEGNVLTMYTEEGDKVVYESNEDGVYVETSGSDGDILAMIAGLFGGGSDGKKLYKDDIFVGEVNVEGEDNDFFAVKLASGLSTPIYVDLVGYPVNFPVSIEYIPAQPITVVKNCCGFYSAGQFFYDDIIINQLGDRVVLNYIGQPDVEYVFEGDGYYDVADADNVMPGELIVDKEDTVKSQYENIWTESSTNKYATITYKKGYQTVDTTVPVTMVKSEVSAIVVNEINPIEYYENSCGYYSDNGFVYDIDHIFEHGALAITVVKVDGSSQIYFYDAELGEFVTYDESGEVVVDVLDKDHFYVSAAQDYNPWVVGDDNNVLFSYCGATTSVDVTVLKNPVVSVEFSSPELLKVKEGSDGYWFTNRDDDQQYFYDCEPKVYEEGNAITITYNYDGETVVDTFVFKNGKGFVNSKGEQLDTAHLKVTAFAQDGKPWEINNEYEFQLTYQGVTCDVPVKVIPANIPAAPKTNAANVANGIKVTWNTMLEAESYYVYRRAAGEKSWSLLKVVTGGQYIDTNVKNGVYYKYIVRAKNDNGLSVFNEKNTALIKCIATPVMKRIINATTGIYIDWAKLPGATHYRVYRRAAGEGTWKYMGQTRNLWWVDRGLANANGGYYRYTVRAVVRVNNVDTFSGYDAEGLLIKRLANPMVKSATDCATGIEIKWKMVAGTTGYYVYRKVVGAPETTWVCLGSVAGVRTTSFIDTTAEKGVAYQYTVRSCWGDTLSSYNEGVVYGAPDMPELKTIANTVDGVQITWGKAARANAYRVYRRVAGGSWVYLGTTNETTYLDKAAPNGKYVAYTVRGVNNLGFSSYNTQGLLTKYVATPKLSAATYNAKTNAVTVKWTAVAGATEYHVYRRVAGGAWVLVDATSTSYYVDKDVKAGSYYVYTVRAVNDWRSAYQSGIAVNTVANVDKF